MEEELIQIVDAYRQMVPTEKLFELIYKSKEYYLSFDGQQELLQHLIYDSITSKYPPCRRYILRFLQRYLEELELNPATTDISDELCEEIALLVKYNTSSKDPTTQDLYHLSYRNPKECKLDLVITCRVARCCNEVGLKLWEAALYLAEFSLLNPTLFRDRKILELGSGVGLTGLVIATYAQPKDVYMTDYAIEVLSNLAYNVEINKHLWEGSTVEVKSGKLDWDFLTEEDFNEIKIADMLLCADCVYDKTSFPSIIRILHLFFDVEVETKITSIRKAIFAISLRNENTFLLFLTYLEKEGIMYKNMKEDRSSSNAWTMPDVTNHIFEYDNRGCIYLWELYKPIKIKN